MPRRDIFTGEILEEDKETMEETPIGERVGGITYAGTERPGLARQALGVTAGIVKKYTEPGRPEGVLLGPYAAPVRGMSRVAERVAGVTERAMQPLPKTASDLSREVTDSILQHSMLADPYSRQEVTAPTAPRPSGVVSPSLSKFWGAPVTTETLPGGGTRYTTPEGIMTTARAASPEAEEQARAGVMRTADLTRAGIETGLEKEYQLAQESRARGRGEEAYAELERQRELGIVPKTGMAEYEENAARLREETRLQGIASRLPIKERAGVIEAGMKSRAELEKTKLAGAVESEKARTKYAADIYAASAKSQADWAKLGIAEQDVRSKAQYRQAQIDDLLTRTGLLEPMKLQLQGAKDAMESRRIERDWVTRALKEDVNLKWDKIKSTIIPGMPLTPEQNQEVDDLITGMHNAYANIEERYPSEGQVKQFPDGTTGKFVNGQWVDITDQVSRGVTRR